jgi:hypothetical protein
MAGSLFTAENKKWAAPKSLPWKAIIGTVLVLALVAGGVWYAFWGRDAGKEPEKPFADPVPAALSAVEVAGVSSLLNQFTRSPREVRGTISDGPLKADITGSVSADGKQGFGTINAAGTDGSTLLADGVTYIKGSPTFWSALGVQTNFPGYVRIKPGFLGDRVYLPATTVAAALAPVERATILGNNYTPSDSVSAVFGSRGLEQVTLPDYDVKFSPADDAGIRGTSRPIFDAIGPTATLERVGSVWDVKPPAPPAPGEPG